MNAAVLHAQISSSSSNQFKSLASAYRTKQYCNDGMHDGMDGCNNFPEGGMDRKPTSLCHSARTFIFSAFSQISQVAAIAITNMICHPIDKGLARPSNDDDKYY